MRIQEEHFEHPSLLKTISFGLMGVGLVLFIIGVLTNLDNPARIWTSLLYNNHYFILIGLMGLFFVASQTIGYNGWFIMIRRISEALAKYIWVGAILMIPILLFGLNNIYYWSTEHAIGDSLVEGKAAFLNSTGFYIRSAVYLLGWAGFAHLIVNNSRASDKDDDISLYNKSKTLCAIFLVFFGVTSSTSAWDWLMSIDAHWFSTLYGWYTFISTFVASMAMTALIILILKSYGYLRYVTDEHIHDVGKYMFAFSVAWAYLWFSQFMLIWYANIPEETIYYRHRWENYPILFFGTFVINFVVPILVLMTRGAKRRNILMMVMAVIIIFGHWMDFYMLAMPGSMKEFAHISGQHHFHYPNVGVLEFSLFLFYMGLFSFVVMRNLTQASLVPVNHPFAKESLYHHT